jgi:hypothetical protein
LAFFWFFLLAPLLSVLREDREREASWNVAIAGVEGLLARPLFVVTVELWGAGGTDSLLRSLSSALFSFLLVVGVGVTVVSCRSTSFFALSILIGATGSGGSFASGMDCGHALDWGLVSGALVLFPFALFDADELGRPFPPSALADCTEFLRARVGTGTGIVLGAGDARTVGLGSGSSVITGDVVAEVGKPVGPFLLRTMC